MRGKAMANTPNKVKYGDHPRLCGEKVDFVRCNRHNAGSPPPMRGKVQVFSGKMLRTGITPAYAGKRSAIFAFKVPERDHPRLCGEKPTHDENIFSWGGSPPPMRGKVRRCRFSSTPDRITPAYAGKRSVEMRW